MSKFSPRKARAAAVATTALAALAAAPAGALASSPTIANTPGIERMVQSTGNLYWTADTGSACPRNCSAEVYRTGKNSTPGQEIVLWRETSSATPVQFGDLTYALVNGASYAYFVANYPATHTSLIKRVPLTGGTAVTLATSPQYIGTNDLITDGSFLYWADAASIRRMPIAGGAIQKGFRSPSLSRLRIVGNRLYFSDGDQVDVTATTGGTVAVIDTAPSAITALDAVKTTTSAGTEVAYGTDTGNVYLKTSTMAAPALTATFTIPGTVTSVSVDAATADVGFSFNDAVEGNVIDEFINPSSGQRTGEWTFAPSTPAGNVQLDDSGSFGSDEYFTTPNAVERFAF